MDSAAECLPYLSALNERQRAAVVHDGSPLLILAGAGSGKTRVITTKIAYLIREKGVDPRELLAVTFTKKAANEMAARARAIEVRAEHAQLRTFHSFGAWFLRAYAEDAGLSKSFTVYDDGDAVTLLMKAVPSLSKQQATRVAHRIALAKDYCLAPDDDLSSVCGTFDAADLAAFYTAYEKRLRATGNADFGDLIMLPVMVMQSDERIRLRMTSRFRVIMVDEYQDSNIAQFQLLKTLSGAGCGDGAYVCVVGDDDQSIYRFRGAEVQNILSFQDCFPGTTVIRLEQNYRSTAQILEAASRVVSNNDGRLGKTLHAVRGTGKQPVLAYVPNQEAEAQLCADMIAKSHAGTAKSPPVPYSQWAILYRTNAQSRSFEMEFLKRRIPYVVVGSLKFYEREEVKDILAYLSFIANPRDELAFRRIVNKPARGVGEKTQDAILAAARSVPAETATGSGGDLLAAAKRSADTLPKKAAAGIREFVLHIETARAALSDGGALSRVVQCIAEQSGLLEYHREDEIAGTNREANIQEVVNAAAQYAATTDGLLSFLDSIELDRTLTEETERGGDAVTLITLHNTKGLEFPRVIITGLEHGIFPRADKTGAELEEERRLFYVGITRAQDELYITSCAYRTVFGHGYTQMEPSVFLMEAGDAFRVIGEPLHGNLPVARGAAGGGSSRFPELAKT